MLLGTSFVVTQPCQNTRPSHQTFSNNATFSSVKSSMAPRRSCSTFTPSKLNVNAKRSPYHDGVGEITISLALQPHGAQLSSHVAIRGGFIEGGLPYTSHFGGHEEGQHALEGRKGNTNIKVTNQEFTYTCEVGFLTNPWRFSAL